MTLRPLTVLAWVSVLGIPAACTSTTENRSRTCTAGAEEACQCPDGRSSAHRCGTDGKWGACDCGANPAGGAAAGGTGGGVAPTGGAAGSGAVSAGGLAGAGTGGAGTGGGGTGGGGTGGLAPAAGAGGVEAVGGAAGGPSAGAGGGASVTPGIESIDPAPGTEGVALDTDVTVVFAQPMDPATLSGTSLTLTCDGVAIAATPSLDAASRVATLDPVEDLPLHASCTVTLTEALTDAAGTALFSEPYTSGFRSRDCEWGAASELEAADPSASVPRLAVNAAGQAVVAWLQSDGADVRVWSRIYDPTTGVWSTARPLSAASATAPGRPDVAIDPAGTAIVAWTQGYDLSASRYVAGSGWVVAASVASSPGADGVSAPRVAVDPAGNVLALWTEFQLGPPISSSLHANLFSASTAAWGSATTVRGGILNGYDVAAAGDGTFEVLLVARGATAGVEVMGSLRYLPVAGWQSEVTHGSVYTSFGEPRLVANQGGDCFSIWGGIPANGVGSLRAERYTAGSWEADARIGALYVNSAAIDVAETGEALALWVQADALRWNRFRQGTWRGDAALTTVGAGVPSEPAVAADGLGGVTAAWVEAGHVRANRYVNELWQTDVPVGASAVADATELRLAADERGRVTATWTQSDGTAPSIWVNRCE